MKTLICFNLFDTGGMKYYLVDGDLSRFENVYVNSSPAEGVDAEDHYALCDELSDFIWDNETGEEKFKSSDSVPLDEIRKIVVEEVATDERILISVNCGFIP